MSNNLECFHGRSKRQCNECDLENELEQLKQENAELKAKLAKYDKLSIEITNLDQYGEDGEVQGVYLPNKIIQQFDDLRHASSEQALNDIKADAVLSIMDEEYSCETPIGDISVQILVLKDFEEK